MKTDALVFRILLGLPVMHTESGTPGRIFYVEHSYNQDCITIHCVSINNLYWAINFSAINLSYMKDISECFRCLNIDKPLFKLVCL